MGYLVLCGNEKRNRLPPKQRANLCLRQLQLFVLPLHSGHVPEANPLLSFSLSLPPFFPSSLPPLSLFLFLALLIFLLFSFSLISQCHSQDLLSVCDVFTVAYRMQRAGSLGTQPLRFGPRVRILEMRGSERMRDQRERGWGARRFEEAGRRGGIAEVGHHVNCIPDCGLLKSGALHRATPPPLSLFNPGAATPNWI